jgi:hypothetical protein
MPKSATSGTPMSTDDLNLFVTEFQRHTGRQDGLRVVAGLSAGLGLLSDHLYLRLHEDVEKACGADSMLVPVSEVKSRAITKTEIGLYQVAESTVAVREGGYLPGDDDWYVNWLAQFRLGESPLGPAHRRTIDAYLSKTLHARTLAFTDVLATVLPESGRAPLVLFALFPPAVQIATAVAFGDQAGAESLRASQVELLPIIPSCHDCHGRVLDNGQSCPACANPLWKTEWLTSVE